MSSPDTPHRATETPFFGDRVLDGPASGPGLTLRGVAKKGHHNGSERIFVELMTSECILEASREGSKEGTAGPKRLDDTSIRDEYGSEDLPKTLNQEVSFMATPVQNRHRLRSSRWQCNALQARLVP